MKKYYCGKKYIHTFVIGEEEGEASTCPDNGVELPELNSAPWGGGGGGD